MTNPYAPPSTKTSIVNDGNSLASLGDRFIAALIDGLIGFAVMFPFMYFMGLLNFKAAQAVSMQKMVLIAIIGLVVYFIIHGKSLASNGQTIGKKIRNIKIVSTDNSAVPFSKIIFVRYLPFAILGTALPLLSLVNIVFIFGKQRRCLHDYLANTKVVNT